MWGAWIEILCAVNGDKESRKSLPVWGAWIEMMYWMPEDIIEQVAPRVGSVD